MCLAEALFLPADDIAEACVANPATLFVRQITRLHRENDTCPTHAFAFPDLLDTQPF